VHIAPRRIDSEFVMGCGNSQAASPSKPKPKDLAEIKDVEVGQNVRCLTNATEFRQAFARFPDNSENGWSQDKQQFCGQTGIVTESFDDKTAKIKFTNPSPKEFDVPCEVLVVVESPPVGNAPTAPVPIAPAAAVQQPQFQLQQFVKYAGTRENFSRFQENSENGWSEEKQQFCGQVGTVMETFDDNTARVKFTYPSLKELDFPCEVLAAVQSQQVYQFEEGQYVQYVGTKEAFSRFPDNSENGWSQQKEDFRGTIGKIKNIYEDNTATVKFKFTAKHGGGKQELKAKFDMPYEAMRPLDDDSDSDDSGWSY